MAASQWTVFARAKHKIGIRTAGVASIDLSGDTFKLTLHRTAASANIVGADVSIFSSVGSLASGGGAATGTGVALAGVTWTTGASLGQHKWDANDVVVTAGGGSNLSAVRYAVIRTSIGATSGALLCYAALSTAEFNVNDGNTLTIQMDAAGIFTLT
jgi:hypothetical protein